MNNVIPIRRVQEPVSYGGSATLAYLSYYAEDDTRPLPDDPDRVVELLNWTREVRRAMQDLEKRLELEAMR